MEQQTAYINRRSRQYSREVHVAGVLGLCSLIITVGALFYELLQ